VLSERVAETQFLDEALGLLYVPLYTGRLGAPYNTDMVMYSEEVVDLGNYSARVVGAWVGLKILEQAEDGPMLKDGVCACSFGLSCCWVKIDEVGTHLLGDVYGVITVDVGR
jgi:hypothetical protein